MQEVNTKSLKQRLRLIFLIILLLVVCGEAGIRYWIELPQISAVQIESDKKDFKRVIQSINSSLKNIQVWSYDYGVWEDSYNYMKGLGDGVQYINKNYLFGTFQAAGMSGAKLIDDDYQVKFECDITHLDEQCDTQRATQIQSQHIRYITVLLDSANQDTPTNSGIFISDNKPYLYGISRIINPRDQQSAGYLLFLQKLDDDLIGRWRTETQLDIKLQFSQNDGFNILTKKRLDEIDENYSYSNKEGYLSFSLPDLAGDKLILISFKADSELNKQHFISMSLILGLTAGLIILLLYSRLIEREVVKPMEYISVGLNKINETSDYKYKFTKFNTHEVNRIINAFNSLLEKVQSQQKQLQEKNKSLELLTRQDYLTGLSNRRHLDDISELLWHDAIKHETSLCVCMIDCDCFKQYNDFYGHKKGDELLVELASLLKEIESQASNVYACRYGGDELVLLIHNMPIDDIESMLMSLKQKLIALNIEHEKSYLGRVSISIGFYLAKASEEKNINPFFVKADKALYLAKHLGRNTIANYQDIKNSD